MKYKTGEEFLNRLYTDMYKSDVVMHTKEKQDTKEEAIKKYLDRLEHAHDIASKSEHNLDILKRFYYQKYIIKELPESYIEHQKKIARERGYGDIYVDDKMQQELLRTVKEDQKKSLDAWIEYFISNDSIYPMWFKNYAFQGMISLGIFDKEKYTFTKRTDKTTAPFIELNREVLSLVYDTLKSEIGENEVNEEYEKALKNGESFKKLYTYYLTKQNYKSKNDETDGIWINYEQGSDYHILCDTLKGKNTGWCIAGEEVARKYLENGDFYIYYTKGDTLKYTEPRIAIRMEGKSIAEVRGVGPEQNLEPNMLKIADKKLDEFEDKKDYKKKVNNMKLLTNIENKTNNNEELTKEELIFLYEIKDKIEGFGYQKDPRIEEIKQKRDIKKDLNYLFDKIKILDGEIYLLEIANLDGLVFPKIMNGDLNLHNIKNVEGLVLPKIINGDIDLHNLESAKGLVLPKVINGGLDLHGLKSLNGIELPKIIKGHLNLHSLESAEGLVLPRNIRNSLDLHSLKSAEGLVLPKIINGDLYLDKLKSAEVLVFPKKANYSINLSSLKSAKGLNLPEIINGSLYLCNLTSTDDIILPKIISENLWLDSLESLEGLVFPEKIGGDVHLSTLKGLSFSIEINGMLNLSSLEKSESLVFPKELNFGLNLNGLKSAEGLVLPEIINGSLYLRHLTSTEGLVLPKVINGNLDLSSLESVGILKLPETKNHICLANLKNAEKLVFSRNDALNILFLSNLESVDEIVFPKKINNVASLDKLKNALKLILPEEVNGIFDLPNLINVEEIILPKKLQGSIDLSNLLTAKTLVLPNKLDGIIDLRNLISVENLVMSKSLYDDDSKLEKIRIFMHLKNGEYINKDIFRNVIILSDEEYSEYYDGITTKQESEKVR